jgi:hypothetical protein
MGLRKVCSSLKRQQALWCVEAQMRGPLCVRVLRTRPQCPQRCPPLVCRGPAIVCVCVLIHIFNLKRDRERERERDLALFVRAVEWCMCVCCCMCAHVYTCVYTYFYIYMAPR